MKTLSSFTGKTLLSCCVLKRPLVCECVTSPRGAPAALCESCRLQEGCWHLGSEAVLHPGDGGLSLAPSVTSGSETLLILAQER